MDKNEQGNRHRVMPKGTLLVNNKEEVIEPIKEQTGPENG